MIEINLQVLLIIILDLQPLLKLQSFSRIKIRD